MYLTGKSCANIIISGPLNHSKSLKWADVEYFMIQSNDFQQLVFINGIM
jgi:hypothetical protein